MTCPRTNTPCSALGDDGCCYGFRFYGKRSARKGEPYKADKLPRCPWEKERKK